jgi:alpha-D-ribose 1-methylphosphonate 5-triphosphate synthase subunit PhnH
MSNLPALPGFTNPVDDAQAVFRALLGALSRPGISASLAGRSLPPPVSGLTQGMLAVALGLCDQDTPLWLDSASDTPETRRHLRFHCASPFAVCPLEAAFAFISEPAAMPRLREFNPGRPDFPDRSATLVISAGLSHREAQTVEASGPGIKGNDRGAWQRLSVSGLPGWFWEDWEENRVAHPLGVDVIFVDDGARDSEDGAVRLLGLPRTVRVRPAPQAQARAI